MTAPSHLPRLLLLSEIFPPRTGGSGRWFWEIYSRLPRDRVMIVAGEDPQAEAFDQRHDLTVLRRSLAMATRGLRPWANSKHYWRTAGMIGRLVREHAIDVVHAGRNLPEGFVSWLARRRFGIPYICYVHGEDVGVSATSRELAWMTRRVFRSALGVVANSRNTRRMLIDQWRLPEAKVHLLHPGVDTSHWVPAPRNDAIRRQLGWAERTVLLTVGRLQKRKGHDMLIRALPTIRRAVPSVLYAIVGEGEEEGPLRKLAEQEGVASAVQFLGSLADDQLRACYQQCDLFVLPNRAVGGDVEGFGMVLLEAQACGKPVLAGASGGTAETMRIPETGRVVDCSTPEPLAAAIVELLGDPAALEMMGRRGRDWAVEHFDWNALAEEARRILSRLNPN